MDFTVSANQRVKIKESEKRDKYLDLTRELRKPGKSMVTVMPVVTGAPGIVSKVLMKGRKVWKSRAELRYSELQNCQDRLEYLRESWTHEKTCCLSKVSERPFTSTDNRNSQ